MSYIDRNEDGNIVSIYLNQQYPEQEYLEGAVLWTDPKLQILKELQQTDEPFTPRRMREFMKAYLETDIAPRKAAELGVTPEEVLLANPFYQVVKTYEDIAIAKRAELQAL